MREKQGAGCPLSNALIALGLVPGPEAFIAWTVSAVLKRAQAVRQSQKETEIIPDLQRSVQGSLQERAESGKAQAMEVIAFAPEGDEDEAPEADPVVGSLPELQGLLAAE